MDRWREEGGRMSEGRRKETERSRVDGEQDKGGKGKKERSRRATKM